MLSVDHRTATKKVKSFMAQCDGKVLDILVRYYKKDHDLRDEIDASLDEKEITRSRAVTGTPTSPTGSNSYGNPSPSSRRNTHRHSSSAAAHMPSTPPQTASSVKSYSSKSGRAAAKYIVIVSHTDDDVEEEKVRFEVAPIMHSVIREDVVRKPEFGDELVESDLQYVLIPCSTGHSELKEVQVTDSIKLTWSNVGAKTTHRSTFYVVANNMLDIDVVLGTKDTGESTSAMNSNAHNLHDRPFGNNPARASYPTNPNSFHASAWESSDSAAVAAGAVPGHQLRNQHVQQQHPQHILNSVMGEGRPHHTGMNYGQPSGISSTTVLRDPHPTHIQTSHTARSVSDLPASSTTSDPNTASDKIRLEIDWPEWRKSPIRVWLDMCASGGAFFQAFQKQVEKKPILERNETRILLKRDRKTSDKEEYVLMLGTDELDADWGITLDWLRENMKVSPPHIYGRVEVGDG